MKKIFTILDTKGAHGNIRVNAIKNNLNELKVHSLFSLEEKSIVFKGMRKYLGSLYIFLRNLKAKTIINNMNNNEIFLSFSGEFCEYYTGDIILDLDDPKYTSQELNMISKKNVIAVIVTTNKMKEKYFEYGIKEKPIYVIPTPVDLKARENDNKNIDNIFRTIYYATHISNEEVEIIESISKRMNSKCDFEFIVIGKSDKKIKGTNIIRFQSLSHEKIGNVLETVNVGLYLRKEDRDNRLSVKIIEMMSFGIPIISTNVSESFPIKQNDCGIIIEGEEIADRLHEIYLDPRCLEKFSLNALAGSEKYKLEAVIEEYERLLSKYR